MSTNLRHQLISQLRIPLDSQPLLVIITLTSRYKLDKKINALEFQRLQKVILHFPSYHYYFMHSLVEHVMYEKIKVNNLVTLYVTQASAGAMTSFSYHYYLYDTKKSEADFMSHINDETPFMVTSDEKATATVEDGQLYLHVRGDVYSFHNSSYLARIHLEASPY